MLQRLRRMHISLAAKCQLLFGAAVVLIIAAALFVPFQRMEQLMDQLNVAAAGTLADAAIREHVEREKAEGRRMKDEAEGAASTRPVQAGGPTTEASGTGEVVGPTTVPVGAEVKRASTLPAVAAAETRLPPRLIGISEAKGEMLTKFEKRAIGELLAHRSTPFYARTYENRDGTSGYRYARALYAERQCVACHEPGKDEGGKATTRRVAAGATTREATTRATASVRPGRMIGIVSVDIESQIETNQLLLNRVFLLTAGLLAGTLAIVVFYLITTRLILQPVRVLQETAEKVSEGNLNIRSDISTGDEFQQLSETFNTMLSNLQASEDQLRAINQSLDLKLNQMAESNLALYESNRLKSEFLANVSHELRTPLNSILGFAELLKDSPAQTDAKAVRYVQNILNSGRNLLDLINDLLDLAKIEAGRMEVRSEPLSLPDLFEGLGSILKPLTEQKNLILDPTVDTDVPILHTDPAKLQQILYNFLSNAIKFSPPGGRVGLSAERESEGAVRISVTDQGPGIELDKQQVIFEKFRQIDGSVTRQHSGTGLGLSISKELTTLLGGTIGVHSVPGQGATFFVTLPLKIQARMQDLRKGVEVG